MVDIWKALGDAIGRAFGSLVKAIQSLIAFKPGMIKDVDVELAGATLKEEKFKSPEIKKFVKDLKEKLKGSPEGLLEWFEVAYFDLCSGIYDVMITVLIPTEIKTFDDAKAEAGHLTQLMIDYILLTGILDVLATAFSGTLIRNIVHISRLFAGTFGLNNYVQAVINPAMYPAFLNILRQGWNAQFPTEIPGVTDLVRMETREVWREEFRDELLKPPPTADFYTWMSKRGFSKDQADSYWAAHWVLPSVGQGYDAYHRLPEFGLDDLKKLMVRLDILPFYQDMLINLAWRIPGAIEARWMYRYAEIPVEGLEEIMVSGGLDPAWAPRVARAVAKNQFRAEITKLVTNAKADYVKGYSLEPELRADLAELEIPEDWITYHVADATGDRERAHKDDLVDIYVDAWRKDLIPDEDTFRELLASVIVNPDVIESIAEREYIRKYKKPKEET